VCESLQSLEATLEAVLGLGHHLIVQQYVKRAEQDIRVLVVGGQAVAAVRRRPQVGRLFQTLNTGARLERVELPAAHRLAAERAASLMGLEVAAVDMLDVRGRPKVFEINSSPAIAAMEQATGQDLASLVIARAEALVREHREAGLVQAGQEEAERGSPPRPKRGRAKVPPPATGRVRKVAGRRE
jgi:ribosomal protein S6--L-glutamate ligase